MQTSIYLKSLALFCGLSLNLAAQAATPPPPWIASVHGENLAFTRSTCVERAASALQRQGFARVTQQGEKVFAALQEGKNYGYKAIVNCFPTYNLVTVTVVAERSGGLQKAQSILATLRTFAQATGAGASAAVGVEEMTGFPDCSDGPTLLRCLNSIPNASLDLAAEYLRKR